MKTSPLEAIAEVIESSSRRFVAQCRTLHEPPAFGAIVKTITAKPIAGDEEIDPFATSPTAAEGTQFAVVYQVRSGSLESGRRSAAYGMDEQELRKEQPHIYELLVTEFSAIVVGFVQNDRLFARIPSHPPRLHSQIYDATNDDYRFFAEGDLGFLPSLLNLADCPDVDDLVASTLRWIFLSTGERAFLIRASKELAGLLRSDYDRLRRILDLLE